MTAGTTRDLRVAGYRAMANQMLRGLPMHELVPVVAIGIAAVTHARADADVRRSIPMAAVAYASHPLIETRQDLGWLAAAAGDVVDDWSQDHPEWPGASVPDPA